MKPKRTILVFDEPVNLPALRVVLETRGYRVLACDTETKRQSLLVPNPVDLQLVGPRMEVPDGKAGEPPILVRCSDHSVAQELERIRIALIRRRGPKPKAAAA